MSKKLSSRPYSSRSCGSIKECPICGRPGQLKQRRASKPYYNVFFAVDHYKRGNSHSSGWDSTCYLKTAEDQEKALNPRRSKDRVKIRLAVGVGGEQ